MELPISVHLSVDSSQTSYPFTVADNSVSTVLTPSTVINATIITTPEYHGTYTVTPSSTAQVLLTADLKCTDNITVNPIPSNYGLITWNGSSLTVS